MKLVIANPYEVYEFLTRKEDAPEASGRPFTSLLAIIGHDSPSQYNAGPAFLADPLGSARFRCVQNGRGEYVASVKIDANFVPVNLASHLGNNDPSLSYSFLTSPDSGSEFRAFLLHNGVPLVSLYSPTIDDNSHQSLLSKLASAFRKNSVDLTPTEHHINLGSHGTSPRTFNSNDSGVSFLNEMGILEKVVNQYVSALYEDASSQGIKFNRPQHDVLLHGL